MAYGMEKIENLTGKFSGLAKGTLAAAAAALAGTLTIAAPDQADAATITLTGATAGGGVLTATFDNVPNYFDPATDLDPSPGVSLHAFNNATLDLVVTESNGSKSRLYYNDFTGYVVARDFSDESSFSILALMNDPESTFVDNVSATIHMHPDTLNDGDANLAIAAFNGSYDPNGSILVNTDIGPGETLNVRMDAQGFLQSPAQVPLPASLPLLGAGLAGLAGFRAFGRRTENTTANNSNAS